MIMEDVYDVDKVWCFVPATLLGAMPRPQRHQLDREIQAGRLVRGPLHLVDRPPGDLYHHQECADAERHQLCNSSHDGGV